MNKIAVIFPGNIASYSLCLNNYKILCDNNIDIYILYSKKINYIHKLFGGNINIIPDSDDIDLIKTTFGENIKYLSAIENEPEYEKYLNTYINIFKNNSEWVETLKEKQLINPTENSETLHTYMDQFIRTKFLYDVITNSGNSYDYIVRLRIDQMIDTNLLLPLIVKLHKNIYPLIWNNIDNIYAVHRDYFEFFNYLLNNFGIFKEDPKITGKNYQLGPEVQFCRSVINFFESSNIHTFHSVLNLHCQITFGVCINNNIYYYDSRLSNVIGEPFGSYVLRNNITKDNYERMLDIFKSKDNINVIDKYKNYSVMFYYVMINK